MIGWDRILEDGTPNKCYHAPYSTNSVSGGDGIILSDSWECYEWLQYIGKWKYLYLWEQPVLLTVGQMELFFEWYKKSVISDPTAEYSKEFTNFYYYLLDAWVLQLHNINGDSKYPFMATHRLNKSFVDELKSLHEWFGSAAHEIIEGLNERKVIGPIDGGFELHQNRNSRAFFRDANYSLSVVDPTNPDTGEVAMISFAPCGHKELEIVQIAWNGIYKEDFLSLRTELVDHLKEYAKEDWFEGIKIPRWDKKC